MQLLFLSSPCVYSSMGPIYTLEATKKGSSPTVSGLVFASYSFVIFILSPIFGKYLPKLGPMFVFLWDNFLKELVKSCLDLYRH